MSQGRRKDPVDSRSRLDSLVPLYAWCLKFGPNKWTLLPANVYHFTLVTRFCSFFLGFVASGIEVATMFCLCVGIDGEAKATCSGLVHLS